MAFDVKSLASVSRRLGAKAGYIQGGGGNTSLKDGTGQMVIKASGLSLSTVDAMTSFITLDSHELREKLAYCGDEKSYGALLSRCIINRSEARRPSIESGFHALLGTCVIHTHSVWINLLTCSQEGRDLAQHILPEAVWVFYATPGCELTHAVLNAIAIGRPNIVLLENHGLVVSGDDPETTFLLHEEVNRRVIEGLGLDLPFPWPGSERLMQDDLLFPDQAIYNCDPELQASQAGMETRQAVSFILAALTALNLSPRFLEDSERNKLMNLESEKYRQKMVRA